MKSLIQPLRNIGLLTVALTLALAANFAYGQWANPTQTPPGGQVAVPIHTATSTQIKTGNIAAVELLAGRLMASPVYCDENGFGPDGILDPSDNCFETSDVGTGGGGGNGFVSGTDLHEASKMFQAYGIAPPVGMYAWPDWFVCGDTYDITSPRKYKENYDASGVSRRSFDSSGGGSCGGIRNICQTRACGIYGTGASGTDLLINPAEICNAYGCSIHGACAPGGNCPSSAGDICNQYGCSEFGSCAAGGCPTSLGQVCDAYGCS